MTMLNFKTMKYIVKRVPWHSAGMGKIENLVHSALLNWTERRIFFSSSNPVPCLFEFLHSSWKWMRLLQQN